jgi:putative redox protein
VAKLAYCGYYIDNKKEGGMMQANVEWQGKMRFVGKGTGENSVVMDAPPAVGGENNGFRPKELLLNGLAGCTAMDVLSILRKMRCEPEAFRVEVSAEETTEHPRVFSSFHITYFIKGEVPPDKLEKAINLSQERYCGVTTMFRQFATVSHEYVYE